MVRRARGHGGGVLAPLRGAERQGVRGDYEPLHGHGQEAILRCRRHGPRGEALCRHRYPGRCQARGPRGADGGARAAAQVRPACTPRHADPGVAAAPAVQSEPPGRDQPGWLVPAQRQVRGARHPCRSPSVQGAPGGYLRHSRDGERRQGAQGGYLQIRPGERRQGGAPLLHPRPRQRPRRPPLSQPSTNLRTLRPRRRRQCRYPTCNTRCSNP